MDLASSILIVVSIVIILIVLSACCRSVRQSCETHVTNAELARRRQAFYMSQVNQRHQDTRVVRVATIEQNSNHVAYEVYEIQLPPNARQQEIASAARHNHGNGHRRPHRPRRARNHPELHTPPPPFRTALQVSTPVASCYSQQIDLEEPPPSYDEYLKQGDEGDVEKSDKAIERY